MEIQKMKSRRLLLIIASLFSLIISGYVFKSSYDSEYNRLIEVNRKQQIDNYYEIHNVKFDRDLAGLLNIEIDDSAVAVPNSYVAFLAFACFSIPLIMLIYIFILGKRIRIAEANTLMAVQEKIVSDAEMGSEYEKKKNQLTDLLDKNILSKGEYDVKSKELVDEYTSNIESREKPRIHKEKLDALEKAYESGILTEQEYNSKRQNLLDDL